MFDISEFDGKKIAILCETYEERDEFYQTMQDHYREYLRSWDFPQSRKPLEYCYVAGWNGNKQMRCFTCVSSAVEYGCEILTYKELCGRMWKLPPLSGLLNDVQ